MQILQLEQGEEPHKNLEQSSVCGDLRKSYSSNSSLKIAKVPL